MKRNWELEELIEYFTFMPNELSLLRNKTGETRIGFAVIFKFFQYEARFPYSQNEIPKAVVKYVSKQVQVEENSYENYDISSRTFFNHKAQIREFFGFREPTNEDAKNMTLWLSKLVFFHEADVENLKEDVYKRFKELQIEPPSAVRIDRIIRSAIHMYENQFFQETYKKLSKETVSKMEALINELAIYDESDIDYTSDTESMSFSELRDDPGRIGLESVFREITKLLTIRQLGIPETLFNHIPQKIIKRYKLRAVSEKLPELRRHPEHVRYTILSAFFWLRSREITDNLIELLIQIIHRIGVRAESYQELLYIRRKFINKDNLRNAISSVTNAILSSRAKEIWGEGTITCASDSKKFGAWDQNLMTEWHMRYRGRGIMIYWHVEKKSACIYSQLKTCSSSEVSAMIEGLLKHYTDMEVERNFVDTHGQSEVAFAFCHILGFNLMPRLKSIGKAKLYRPDTGISEMYPNLQPILTRNINWDLIRQQ